MLTAHYYFSKSFRRILLGALLSFLIVVVLWALAIGPEGFSAFNWLRFNRVFLAVLVGAALAASGAALQALLKNPLADPYILGVSGGSAVGGCAAIVFFENMPLVVSFASIIGAFIASLVLNIFFKGHDQNLKVLLAGVAINAFAGAFITILKIVIPSQKAQILLYWLVGNLSYVSNEVLCLMSFCIIASIGVLLMNMGSLHLLGMGDNEAKRLGVNVKQVKQLTYLSVSLMVGVSVAFCGMIGFVGLVVPQFLRILFGYDLRIILPSSIFLGAILLTASDGLSRLNFAYFYSEIPVGALTALFGAPVFAWILCRQKNL